MALRDLNVRIGADTRGFDSGMRRVRGGVDNLRGSADRASESMGGIGKAFKATAVIAAVTIAGKAIAKFAGGAMSIASNLSEVQNVVDTTFGSASHIIDAFAKNSTLQFGLSELSAKRYSSTVGAMLKSMGFAQNEVVGMSTSLTGLAGDLASFYNLSGDEAFQKIRAGISGETEPLKQLGINLSVANIEQFALTKGIKKSYNAMTQQEQALLRYQYLLSVTADAQGDFAKTSDSWSNQTRILKESFSSLKGELGAAFIAVLTPVLKGLNILISRLTVAAKMFKDFVLALTGKKALEVGAGAGQMSDDIGMAVDAQDELTGATLKTAKAQQRLAGFDEINTLSSGKDAAGGGGGGGPSFGFGDLGTESMDVSAVTDGLNKLQEKFKSVFDKIKQLWDILYKNTIKPIADFLMPRFTGIVEKLKGKWADLKKEIGGNKVWNDIVTIFTFATKVWTFWGKVIGWVWDKLAGFGIDFFFIDLKFLLKQVESAIGLVAAVLRGDFSGAWQHFKDLLINNRLDWFREKLDLVKAKLGEVATFIRTKVTDAFDKAKERIRAWYENDVRPWFTAEKWNALLRSIGEAMDRAIGKFIEFWVVRIPAWWRDSVMPWFTKEKWMGLYNNIKTALQTKLDEMRSAAESKLRSFWNDTIKPWFTVAKWKELGENMKDGLVGGIRGVVHKVVDMFNGMRSSIASFLNGIIDGYNSVASKTGGIMKTLPKWSPSAIPYPKLAKGGIVSSPTVAMIGEHGTEAVMPLERNTGWIDKLAAKINSSGGGGDIYLTENIYLDDGSLVDTIVRKINRRSVQSGRTVLEV